MTVKKYKKNSTTQKHILWPLKNTNCDNSKTQLREASPQKNSKCKLFPKGGGDPKAYI